MSAQIPARSSMMTDPLRWMASNLVRRSFRGVLSRKLTASHLPSLSIHFQDVAEPHRCPRCILMLFTSKLCAKVCLLLTLDVPCIKRQVLMYTSTVSASMTSLLKTFQGIRANAQFSNIRYAKPPTGGLRFRAPSPPRMVNRFVDQGLVGRVCPQASFARRLVAVQFDSAYLAGKTSNASAQKPR